MEDRPAWKNGSRERQFLGAVVKLAATIVAVVLTVVLLEGMLPAALVQALALAVGFLGFNWIIRGTAFDPFSTHRK